MCHTPGPERPHQRARRPTRTPRRCTRTLNGHYHPLVAPWASANSRRDRARKIRLHHRPAHSQGSSRSSCSTPGRPSCWANAAAREQPTRRPPAPTSRRAWASATGTAIHAAGVRRRGRPAAHARVRAGLGQADPPTHWMLVRLLGTELVQLSGDVVAVPALQVAQVIQRHHAIAER